MSEKKPRRRSGRRDSPNEGEEQPGEKPRPEVEQRRKRRSPRLREVTDEDGAKVVKMDVEQEEGIAALMAAFGTEDKHFMCGLLQQLGKVKGETAAADSLNFLLAAVEGIAPRDEVEAMLAAQMAAIHDATMTLVRRLNRAETIEQQNSAGNTLTKLARTYVAQVEALKRHRSGGEQRVTVEHVHVHEGGQAIVGSVETGGRGRTKKREPTS